MGRRPAHIAGRGRYEPRERRALAGASSSPRRPLRELPGLAFGPIRIMRSSPRPIACPSPRRAGSSVIVEGRITGIASRRPRITLYFGPRQGGDFSVTILPRNSKTFEAAYSSLAGLTGQTVRVRGLLDTRFGPQIEISDPDEMEAAGQGQDAAAPAPRHQDKAPARMGLSANIAGSRRTKNSSGPAREWRLAGVIALLLSACAAMEPQDSTPFNAAVPVPPPRAPGVDTKASAEHRRMIALFDGEYRYPAAEAYLNEILVKLANADERASEPYKVTILNSPIVNAFALPPGELYVTRGLLALANDASEVAAVMAHEIAHITAKHAMQREEEENAPR